MAHRLRLGTVPVLLLLALGAAGCGGASGGTTNYVAAGQVPRSALPTGALKGGRAAADTAATVPLAKQNPATALFTAMGVFQSCLTTLGTKFIGAPGVGGPSAAVNNPAYLKNLSTCASRSDIVQALHEETTAEQNLTPTQVKKENQDYLKWRSCMISRGWGIPAPSPNAKGLLFSFGGTGGSGSSGGGFKAPPGQSILNSPDMSQCAAKAGA